MAEAAVGGVTSQDDLQEAVCGVFAEVLGRPSVRPDDDLIALGTDSLTAVQVTIRLMDELGIEVDILDLFDAATVAELCAVIPRGCVGGT